MRAPCRSCSRPGWLVHPLALGPSVRRRAACRPPDPATPPLCGEPGAGPRTASALRWWPHSATSADPTTAGSVVEATGRPGPGCREVGLRQRIGTGWAQVLTTEGPDDVLSHVHPRVGTALDLGPTGAREDLTGDLGLQWRVADPASGTVASLRHGREQVRPSTRGGCSTSPRRGTVELRAVGPAGPTRPAQGWKTTVRAPQRNTRSSAWAVTARARTSRSTSRPIATICSGVRVWFTRTTSCSMIGPSSSSAVT